MPTPGLEKSCRRERSLSSAFELVRSSDGEFTENEEQPRTIRGGDLGGKARNSERDLGVRKMGRNRRQREAWEEGDGRGRDGE